MPTNPHKNSWLLKATELFHLDLSARETIFSTMEHNAATAFRDIIRRFQLPPSDPNHAQTAAECD